MAFDSVTASSPVLAPPLIVEIATERDDADDSSAHQRVVRPRIGYGRAPDARGRSWRASSERDRRTRRPSLHSPRSEPSAGCPAFVRVRACSQAPSARRNTMCAPPPRSRSHQPEHTKTANTRKRDLRVHQRSGTPPVGTRLPCQKFRVTFTRTNRGGTIEVGCSQLAPCVA